MHTGASASRASQGTTALMLARAAWSGSRERARAARPTLGRQPCGRRGPEPAGARPGDVRWTPEAEARVARAPVFLRGMVRRLAEKRRAPRACA